MAKLEDIARYSLQVLEENNRAREGALTLSRSLVRQSANAIRAVHRGEFEQAQAMLKEGAARVAEMKTDLAPHPGLYYTGYVQDSLKEFAEANLTLALVTGSPLPSPQDLGVEVPAYLNGLGEAAAELRRHILDLIRHGEVERGERALGAMDDIYNLMVSVDYPEAITGGLRRTTDMVRGVIERTRGDLTIALRQQELQRALEEFEKRRGKA